MIAKGTCTIRTYQLFFFLVCLLFSNNLLANDSSPEIFQAAQSGLDRFLNQIPENDLESYGFSQNSLLDHASLGIPLELYKLLPSEVTDYAPGMSVDSLITKTGMWYFPVKINDKISCILIVDRIDNAWKAVSLGNAALAAQLSKVIRSLPKSDRADMKLICSFQAKEYLFTLPQKGQYNLTALGFQGLTNKTDSEKSAPLSLEEVSDTVNRLKPIIENNINDILR
ncbi:MAG: hypothetical protein JEZ12_26300 [Desulfobacterium sp.]|nr:hypothetical protein [Desulfobacterium sp.]